MGTRVDQGSYSETRRATAVILAQFGESILHCVPSQDSPSSCEAEVLIRKMPTLVCLSLFNLPLKELIGAHIISVRSTLLYLLRVLFAFQFLQHLWRIIFRRHNAQHRMLKFRHVPES